MSQHKKADVRILNPAGGRGYTSRKCAERYIREGRAQWAWDEKGPCVEFLENHPRHVAVVTHVRARTEYDLAAATGMASLEAIRNLPVGGDVVLVVMVSPRRKRKAGAGYRLNRLADDFDHAMGAARVAVIDDTLGAVRARMARERGA